MSERCEIHPQHEEFVTVNGEVIAQFYDTFKNRVGRKERAEQTARILNSHEALLATLKHGIVICKECRVTKSCERCELARGAIAQAEARP